MPVEINLFRAKANGGINVVAKTLRYFEVETNDIEKILTSELVNIEYEKISVSSDYVDKQKSIRIYFKETI